MRMLRWMSGVTKLDNRGSIRNERIRGTTRMREIVKKVLERRLTCDEKRGALRRKKGDGNGEERAEGVKEYGWVEGGTISTRRDYRRRKCTTVLHVGACHRASTPHKSGNKMKRKKKARH